jgi:4'-phosphopantetheinyl transferase EntD
VADGSTPGGGWSCRGTVAASPMLRQLFDGQVRGAELVGAAVAPPLLPAEQEALGDVGPQRQQEFAAGRACARSVLAHHGVLDHPLLPGPDRVPVWPPGLVGSITHTRGYCGCVVADRRDFAGLGIDAELRDAVTEDLWSEVFTGEERRWLGSVAPARRLDMAGALFAAKEAFFKAQYPVTGAWLDYGDLVVAADDGRFRVSLTHPIPELARLGSWPDGTYRFAPDLVVAASGLPAAVEDAVAPV